ncbi:MAG: hypothetical protein WC373_05220 [Smithella sp.]|jgi:hypothetical protein
MKYIKEIGFKQFPGNPCFDLEISDNQFLSISQVRPEEHDSPFTCELCWNHKKNWHPKFFKKPESALAKFLDDEINENEALLEALKEVRHNLDCPVIEPDWKYIPPLEQGILL